MEGCNECRKCIEREEQAKRIAWELIVQLDWAIDTWSAANNLFKSELKEPSYDLLLYIEQSIGHAVEKTLKIKKRLLSFGR